MFSLTTLLSYSKILFLFCFLISPIIGLAQSPYKFTVVAQTGPDGLSKLDAGSNTGPDGLIKIDPNISINDKGNVAFIGRFNGKDVDGNTILTENLFVYDPKTGKAIKLMKDGLQLPYPDPVGNYGQLFGPGLQINNDNQVISRRRMNATVQIGFPFGQILTGPFTYLEVWDGNQAALPSLWAMGDAGLGPAASLLFWIKPVTGGVYPSPFVPNSPFDAIFTYPSLSNTGKIAFASLDSGIASLSTPISPPYSYNSIPTGGGTQATATRPAIADDGSVVFRTGTGPYAIQFLDGKTGNISVIADSSLGFTDLGASPSISDDGKVVVFYGNLTDLKKAQEYGTNTGPGIFANLKFVEKNGNTGSKLLRLTGRVFLPEILQDPKDPSKTHTIFEGELGTSPQGFPYFFDSYSPDDRTSIIHHNNWAGESLIICFKASSTSAPQVLNKGIYTQRIDLIDISSNHYKFHLPKPIIQTGELIQGVPIDDISIYDSIESAKVTKSGNQRVHIGRGDYRVVLWAANKSPREYLLVSENLDVDEDALQDEWEENGVTVNGNYIDLPAMGASPIHKDVFVHYDWLAGRKPSSRAIRKVQDAFKIAPVQNPDGTLGISLHVDHGPTSIMNPYTNETWGNKSTANEHSTITSPLGDNDSEVWAKVDSLKKQYYEPSGRANIFHYAVNVYVIEKGDTSVGRTRGIPGSDFVTGFGFPLDPPSENRLAANFMHELGHNLGLKHGGSDYINYKPNYLSVMNYLFSHAGGLILYNDQRELNYSTRKLATLDESKLEETIGIGDSYGHLTFWDSGGNCKGDYNKPLPNAPLGALDWNCNKSLTLGMLSLDIRNDSDCQNPSASCRPPSQLEGHEDWSALVFSGNGKIGSANQIGWLTEETFPVVEEPEEVILAKIPSIYLNDHKKAPIDDVIYSPKSGIAPFKVKFDGSLSKDVDGGIIVNYEWDFGDSSLGAGPIVEHTYTKPGTYYAKP